jgi:ABC-type sugar transport system ATPase subunit
MTVKPRTSDPKCLLEMRGIGKSFGEVRVLDQVDLDVRAGEVHAVVGENGAGKSTLMRIAAGIVSPDEGRMTFGGRAFAPKSPADALHAGIAMVHQELSLARDLTVAENILAGREPRRGWFLRPRKLYETAAAMLAEFCPAIDPHAPVGSLGMGYWQVVEVLKALVWEPRVIVFDEPTSALEAHETELVLETIRKLRARAVGVVYISHRMDEVFRVSDRVTVLRDGVLAASWGIAEVSRPAVLSAMVGRELSKLYPEKAEKLGEILLSAAGLRLPGNPHPVDFSLRRGEILGFSGLLGAGRTELMRAVFGADPAEAGTVVLEGRAFRPRSVREAVEAGIAYVPEDRKSQGLFLDQSVEDNILCAKLGQCSRGGFLRPGLCRELALKFLDELRIVSRGPGQEMRDLSGGNQQKTLLARWLAARPKVLIVDEPTRGIDVGAKVEIHRLLREYAAAGHGVIVVSSEMPELLGLCDRILVLHEGRLTGEVAAGAATEEELIRLATGSAAGACPDASISLSKGRLS